MTKSWYERSLFYNSNFSIPNGSASPFERVLFEENQNFKMISVRGRGRPRREHPSVASFVAPSIAFSVAPSVAFSVAPSVAPSVTPSGFSLPPKSEVSKQPDRTSGPKSPAATSVPKYSKDNLQRILKAVLEAQAPAPAPAISETLREKLKAHSPDIYRGKSHMNCYNFCQ